MLAAWSSKSSSERIGALASRPRRAPFHELLSQNPIRTNSEQKFTRLVSRGCHDAQLRITTPPGSDVVLAPNASASFGTMSSI